MGSVACFKQQYTWKTDTKVTTGQSTIVTFRLIPLCVTLPSVFSVVEKNWKHNKLNHIGQSYDFNAVVKKHSKKADLF